MRLGGLGAELTQQSAAGQNKGHHVKKERWGTWGGHRKPPDIFHLPAPLVPRKQINKFKQINKSMKKRAERVFSWIC